MYRLLRGFDEFRRNTYPQKEVLFTKLSQGQHPMALFITCADSRISPNLITNTEPGDLFVLRNAGNIVPDPQAGLCEAATIEYAVKALNVQDIIVCGHTQCGAMAAVLDPASCASLPKVAELILPAAQLIERVRERHGEVADDQLLDLIIQENVLAQLENLKKHPAVREAVDADEISLHGWVYGIANGDVTVYEAEQDAFVTPSIFV